MAESSPLSNPNPVVVYQPAASMRVAGEPEDALVSEVFDLVRDIKDPEHPHTLEELNVVREDLITVKQVNRTGSEEELWIKIEFIPTVPHCSLATLIGLCLRVKLERTFQHAFKLDIFVSEGTHSIEEDVNKQINDKERVAAAMENPNLRDMVEACIKEVEY